MGIMISKILQSYAMETKKAKYFSNSFCISTGENDHYKEVVLSSKLNIVYILLSRPVSLQLIMF